jgi:excinuclease UvrABC nuclease subunit
MELGETKLYRHFDAAGELLYVGISLNAVYRLSQHKDHSAWFSSISNVTIETFPTRKDALDAETTAIIKEKPKHNIKGKKAATREAMLEAHRVAQEAKELLTKKHVHFRPMYRLDEVADVLCLVGGVGKVRKLIEDGELGHVIIKSAKGKDYWYVTGWQLIDYIESIGGTK